MVWTLLIIFIVGGILVYLVYENSPSVRLVRLQGLFDARRELKFEALMMKLRATIDEPFDNHKHFIHRTLNEYNEGKKVFKVEYMLLERMDKYIRTVLASNTYSIESKQKLVIEWCDYITTKSNFSDLLDIGFTDTGDIYKYMDNEKKLYANLIFTLSSFNFDVDYEQKEITKKVNGEYTKKIRNKKVVR